MSPEALHDRTEHADGSLCCPALAADCAELRRKLERARAALGALVNASEANDRLEAALAAVLDHESAQAFGREVIEEIGP